MIPRSNLMSLKINEHKYDKPSQGKLVSLTHYLCFALAGFSISYNYAKDTFVLGWLVVFLRSQEDNNHRCTTPQQVNNPVLYKVAKPLVYQ